MVRCMVHCTVHCMVHHIVLHTDKVWRMDVCNRERRDAWEVVARLPDKIAFAGLASLGGLLYIFGGCRNRNGVPNERSDERQLWIYDPAAATVTAGPSMRVARQECGGACLGGRVYAFGGAACRECRLGGATACYPGLLGLALQPPWLREYALGARAAEPLRAQNRRLRCGHEARPESPTLQRPPPRVGPFVRVFWTWRVGVAGGGGVPHRARRRRRHGGPVQLHRARGQGLRGRALRPAELQSGGRLGDAASPADRRRLPRGGGAPACLKRPLGGATARQPGLLGRTRLALGCSTHSRGEPGSLRSP